MASVKVWCSALIRAGQVSDGLTVIHTVKVARPERLYQAEKFIPEKLLTTAGSSVREGGFADLI
jgi:hypothetical protein